MQLTLTEAKPRMKKQWKPKHMFRKLEEPIQTVGEAFVKSAAYENYKTDGVGVRLYSRI